MPNTDSERVRSAPSVMSTNQESPTSEATLKSATFQNIGTVNIYDANFSMTSHAVERRDWDAGELNFVSTLLAVPILPI